jgi:class 3 adenylate cyclase/predicted ATPase
MDCPSCHSEMPDDSRFCEACGAALPVRCSACGATSRAGARFCSKCGKALTADSPAVAPPKPAAAPSPPQPASSAERRQLTVMFCDLVGSTALSARLDPEDMREIIGAYHRCCTEQITKAGGFVAKYMGDGVLGYFGYPQAHEDDAERAVRAGLALIEAVPTLLSGLDAALQVRIGIATGLVVVGDLIGEGAAQEHGVVGETPNVAARLQALAEPGQLVISPATRRLAGGMFEYRDLGNVMLKGLAEPIRAWLVTGSSTIESRFEAQHEAKLTPLVGREEELELLMRRWRQAARGEGRVVLLSGEPGIGKSRLTVALQERLHEEPHTRLRYFCSPHHTDSALYPTITQLERAAGFERDDTPAAKLDKVTSLLGAASEQESDIQLLSELLSIPASDRHPPIDWSPQRKKEKTFQALLRQLQMLSRQRPVVLVYEDVHWIDPSSRELLDMIVERVASLPVLLVIAFRPEFQPPWTGQAHVSTLALSRLGRRDGAALVQRVAGNNALSDEIMTEIIDRTDGVPLFVEELTKAVLEAGGDGSASKMISKAPLQVHAVPATLHASLMARLDNLGPAAKEIAQIGAAIGREFSYAQLVRVAQKKEDEVKEALARLSDAGLAYRRGTPPDANFLFKHALVRDAAYGSLLRSQRQQLHGRIVTTLEAEFPEIAAAQPEVLGYHADEAGMAAKAIGFWQKAGELAVRRGANQEAIKHFKCAQSLVEQQLDTVERSRHELTILSRLGPAIMSVHGWASPEVGVAFERAAVVAQRLGNPVELAPPLLGLWLYRASLGQLERADEVGVELLEIAHKTGSTDVRLQAHHAAFPIQWYRGALPEANTSIAALLALYDEVEHEQHRFTYLGHDPAVCALSIGATVQWLLGYPERAVAMEDRALCLARRLRHPPSLAHALWFVCEGRWGRRDQAALAVTASELVALCEDQKLSAPRAAATMYTGWVMAHSGRVAEGIELVERGLSDWDRLGIRTFLARNRCLLAEAYLAGKRYSEGIAQVALALMAVKETGVQSFIARLYQVRALLLLHSEGMDSTSAEADLKNAIEIAQAQSARSAALCAAISLARLWVDQGKRTEARDLLAPIYGWFTEGFDTPDLKEAKVLLEELGTRWAACDPSWGERDDNFEIALLPDRGGDSVGDGP